MAEFAIDCPSGEIECAALAAALSEEAVSDVSLSAEILFTDAEYIRKLNAEARGIDAVTDVLSFPNLKGVKDKKILKENFPYDLDEEGNLFLGSVVVCRERAAEQAEEFGHSLRREYLYLAVHGLCHLLGYDHMNEGDRKEMRKKEERILQKLGAERE